MKMENKFKLNPYRGDKLRLARLAKGYSLEELGNILNVTRQNIHKMEAGQEPTSEQMPLLCKALNVENSYFFTDRNTPVVEEQCHFRSLKSRTKALTHTVMARAEILDQVIGAVEEFVDLPTFEVPNVDDLDFSISESIEVVAERIRDIWGLGDGPVEDITIAVENAGVIVAVVEGVDEKVDAFSMSRKRPVIIRNSSKENPCRYRFDIAHELGHLVMHDGVVTGCKFTEKQANYFASAFLMPRRLFLAATQKYPLIRGLKSLNWQSLFSLKRYFKVSFKALLYRAKSLGIINEAQMKSGYIYLNKNGYTKSEELDDLLPMEEPRLLSDIIESIGSSKWQKLILELGISGEFITSILPRVKIPNKALFVV
ncbi:helix-turn-helix domain-containing protein [Alteromonas macleodii]|uniref:helix-turn-helix domain-containing protein n=1 Tax=Alteromonas macleodii TaxID=28108 RepID=UPI000C76F613|nr:XRE family transcriptional regulator [Alteromonas macleodii]